MHLDFPAWILWVNVHWVCLLSICSPAFLKSFHFSLYKKTELFTFFLSCFINLHYFITQSLLTTGKSCFALQVGHNVSLMLQLHANYYFCVIITKTVKIITSALIVTIIPLIIVSWSLDLPENVLHSSDHSRPYTITWDQCYGVTSTILGTKRNFVSLMQQTLKLMLYRREDFTLP